MRYKLFEYGEWVKISNPNELLSTLRSIWDEKKNEIEINELEEDKVHKYYQPLLNIVGNEIRANNYVGFIQSETDLIEIYPKVFRNIPEADPNEMLRHIFFWFSYCRKSNFPFSEVQLDVFSIDKFPELIIKLIANQFLEIVSTQPLNLYQSTEEALITPKGTINFKRYAAKSLSTGYFQKIECDFEPFLFDNKVNRIIKYCSRLLLNQTKHSENLQTLQNVLFVLDEVEDIPCSIIDIESISLNSYYEDYKLVLDSCKLILIQELYSTNSYELSQWSLLFPMEYIFEDFIAGFLEEYFSNEWKVEYQKSNEYLAKNNLGNNSFQMQHDIFLTSKRNDNRKIIIDTKYKLRHPDFKSDIKKGIVQSDLYQMTSYAFRRGCTEIMLLYPNLTEDIQEPDEFEISSGFNISDKMNITAMEIPFWTPGKLDIEELENKLIMILKRQLDKLSK